MGGSYYSADTLTRRVSSHASKGTSYFTHTSSINSGKSAKKVHERLDPAKLNSAGKNVRESFDSKEHPVSNAVAVLFDVTGSMSDIPRTFVSKLDKLMSGLVKKGYLTDPQILFGAIGDAYADAVPLQIGQFESGNEMDDVLSLIYLESGGGGQMTESYELGMYYMARHTDMDCLNKRNKKGYLFLSGDEKAYSKVSKEQVKNIIGDSLEEDISFENILEELKEKFEVFWILPKGSSHYDNKPLLEYYKNLYGQRLLMLDNPENICELIISTIGINEGYDLDKIVNDLKDLGVSKSGIDSATSALSKYESCNSIKKVVGELPKIKDDSSVERL